MTYAPQTAKTLKSLTWNEIRALHSSMGLKATKTTATRAHYEQRILAAQPQKAADAAIVPAASTAVTKCSECPFAQPLDGNRYVCTGVRSASVHDVVRGHWEVTQDCEWFLEQQAAPATESIAPAETPQPEVVATEVVATIAPTPHATKPKADDNFMTAFTKESEAERKLNNLAYLSELEMKAQLAIEKTVIGSEEEKIAYAHLRAIERDIEFYSRPTELRVSPAVQQLETQMAELKKDVFEFKITPFDPAILATEEPQVNTSFEPEGTIHWETPLRGTIFGKKGAVRPFYLRDGEILIVISSCFTAAESKYPNVRHQQIREAIEAGKQFNPISFKNSAEFESQSENYKNIGRVRQECDGRWWAWPTNGVTGHPFFSRAIACEYLEKVARQHIARQHNQVHKKTACAS